MMNQFLHYGALKAKRVTSGTDTCSTRLCELDLGLQYAVWIHMRLGIELLAHDRCKARLGIKWREFGNEGSVHNGTNPRKCRDKRFMAWALFLKVPSLLFLLCRLSRLCLLYLPVLPSRNVSERSSWHANPVCSNSMFLPRICRSRTLQGPVLFGPCLTWTLWKASRE